MSTRVLAWYESRQRILNGRPVPAKFTTARVPIPVTARIEWERDGIEHIETVATAWTHSLVLVDVSDPRYLLAAAWVGLEDVTRR